MRARRRGSIGHVTSPPVLTIDEHELGLSWVVDETMQRAAHALLVDGAIWLVDPVDVPEAIERAAALAPVTGVIQLLDRHGRDGVALARRLGVPYLLLPDAIPGSPLQVVPVQAHARWREVALWLPGSRTLVVAESVGTAPYFTVGTGPVGVHPMLRLTPPDALRFFAPHHLLVGHGAPVHGDDASAGLPRALDRARRDLWRLPGTVLGLRG